MNTRSLAAQVVDSVVCSGVSLTRALDQSIPADMSTENRSFVKALSFGTLRYYYQLEFFLAQLLSKPLRNKEHFIKMLALVGLYQLAHMRVAPHAAVSATVQAVNRKSWAKGLINGVLRNFQRRQAELERMAEQNPQARTAHPLWMIEAFDHSWQSKAEILLQNNNQQSPMVLRVNRLKYNREDYLNKLRDAGIESRQSEISTDGIILEKPVDVMCLPDFQQGAVYVQDTAAQMAAHFLDTKSNQRVADLCAAPGGKAIHVLELCPQLGELVAVEIDPLRLKTIASNAQRCDVAMTLQCADAVDLESWWNEQLFDRVMLDVPCSGTGVIRRHPDIKLLRRADDVADLVKRQRQLLEAGWKVLSPGGMLLYSTCSVLKEENTSQISWFLATHEDSEELPIEASSWSQHTQPVTPGSQILTGTEGMDGFFYARLLKKS